MKKLMIVAAVAAMVGGSYAACKDEGPASSDAAVYVWQFKGKTSTGIKVSEAAVNCVDGSACAVRIPGALVITAYTYICDYWCEAFNTSLQTQPTQYFASKPWSSKVYEKAGGVFVIGPAHVVGKSATQYELGGVATFGFTDASDLKETFALTFGGFGAFNKKTGLVTSVSGNFAGTQTYPYYNGTINKVVCPYAGYWDCQTLDLVSTMEPSVAFGTWSVKYNAAYSKKLAANKNFRVVKTAVK